MKLRVGEDDVTWGEDAVCRHKAPGHSTTWDSANEDITVGVCLV